MQNTDERDFRSLTMELGSASPRESFEMWAMITWAIWNAQNKFLFEAIQNQPSSIKLTAQSLLQEYQ
ncbi:hypothetical protein FCV25MIE_16518 [Fagus crenata]